MPDLRGCMALALGMMVGGVFLLGEALAEQRDGANAASGVTGLAVLTDPSPTVSAKGAHPISQGAR
jgi:hypothetical protein